MIKNRVWQGFQEEYADTIDYILNNRREMVLVLMSSRGETKRNMAILIRYITTEDSMAEIGRDHGISRERTRQIVNRQLQLVKESLENEAATE